MGEKPLLPASPSLPTQEVPGERFCPNCGCQLQPLACKMRCPNPQCGFFLSCSDYP
jgi:hypothetical protein